LKKSGVLHSELSKIIAGMGHGQTLVIADYGLPVPVGTPCIDLAICRGVPSFLDVLDAVMEELAVASATVATELEALNPALLTRLTSSVGVPIARLPHAAFKQATVGATAVIRTGEHTPYANVILHAGVVF